MAIKNYFIEKKQQIGRKKQMLNIIKEPYLPRVRENINDIFNNRIPYYGYGREQYKRGAYPLDNSKNYVILHINSSNLSYDRFSTAFILDIDSMKTKANFEDCLFIVNFNSDSKWCKDYYYSMNDNPYKFCGCLIESKNDQLNFKLDDTAFDRARRIVKILGTQSNVKTDQKVLDFLTHVYNNAFYVIIDEIKNQYKDTPKTFQKNIDKKILKDLYFNMPLNQFIDKWESWSENNKATIEATIEAEKEKLKQQKQEEKRQKEAKELAEKTELCEYMKL